MASPEREALLKRRIRILLVGFMAGLVVSGLTAFPLPLEINLLADWLGLRQGSDPSHQGILLSWIAHVREGVRATEATCPFLFYGTDWLAFGHLVIATALIGPIRDPVRNVWIVQWGLIACAAVIPLALICGAVRGIPVERPLIDCSFGVVGANPARRVPTLDKRIEPALRRASFAKSQRADFTDTLAKSGGD